MNKPTKREKEIGAEACFNTTAAVEKTVIQALADYRAELAKVANEYDFRKDFPYCNLTKRGIAKAIENYGQ